VKILLLGKNGQVGSELLRTLNPLGEVIALDRHGETGYCGDLSNLDGITSTIRDIQPNIVVNAAAYTAVDRAEDECDQAFLINALAPGRIAREVESLGGLLVHYSSDYVFDGSGCAARKESDPTGPLNFYGASKLAGEVAISESKCNHLILRTSWVYGMSGNNFVKTILDRAKKSDSLSIVNDQFGVPTSADLLANITAHIIVIARQNHSLNGLYHVVPGGETSWYDYAHYVINSARNLGEVFLLKKLIAISSNSYSARAQRPSNSRLDTKKFSDAFCKALPDWKHGVLCLLQEIYKEAACKKEKALF